MGIVPESRANRKFRFAPPAAVRSTIFRVPDDWPTIYQLLVITIGLAVVDQRTRSQMSVLTCFSFGELVRTTIVSLSSEIWN